MKIDASASTNAISIEVDGQVFTLMGEGEDFESGYLLELFCNWLETDPEVEII